MVNSKMACTRSKTGKTETSLVITGILQFYSSSQNFKLAIAKLDRRSGFFTWDGACDHFLEIKEDEAYILSG